METCIENYVNSGKLSYETILSEGLKIEFNKNYYITPNGVVYRLVNGEFILNKTRFAGYKSKYVTTYLSVKSGEGGNYFIHRLVASAFIPNNDPEKTQVNHIDGDTTNNNVSNLEWVTPKENMKHAYEEGLSLRGEECPWSKHSESFIRSICELMEDGLSNKEIRAILGPIEPRFMYKIRHKLQWRSITNEYDF